jgi:hypothetical protein
MRTRRASIVVAACLLALPASAGAAARTKLTSVGPQGAAQGASTYWRSLSGSGRLALFTSSDDDLPGTDGTRDVYVRNLETRRTRLVSRASSGEPASENSGDDPAIAGRGRFVAFTTDAPELPGGEGGVFVHDLRSGKTRLVSKTTGGEPAEGSSVGRPVLSADGRLVSFEANDDDFPGADGTLDAYVHDRKTKRTSLVTKASDGTPVDTDSFVYPAISGNGRFVAFHADSDVLPGADGTGDLYLHDRRTKATTLVSRTPGGDPAGGGTGNAGAVSFNGRFVAFESSAASLGADPSGSAFVRDRKRKTTTLVSETAQGDTAIGYTASISANGRFVCYESEDDDLPGQDGTTDVFRHELETGKTNLVSRSNQGEAGDDDSYYPSISGGGGRVAFASDADNLSGQDDNGFSSAYVRGPLG